MEIIEIEKVHLIEDNVYQLLIVRSDIIVKCRKCKTKYFLFTFPKSENPELFEKSSFKIHKFLCILDEIE
jgi:hypothetical protein